MEYCDFLEKYRYFTQGNETPEIIHLWCGLSALAGAAEKKLWVKQGSFNVYLNLYIVLVGPPGVVAKSTSMKVVRRLLDDAGFNVFEGSVLKEEIVKEMEEIAKPVETPQGKFEHASVTYISDELNILLSSGMDMVKFLTTIFSEDDKYEYKTKRSGQYSVPYPFFNLLCGAVPQWFGNYVASDMASTGFLARSIIVYEEKKRGRWPEPRYDQSQQKKREECLEHLMAIGQMAGQIDVSEDARQFFHEWYMDQDDSPHGDYRINHYMERRNKLHIIKIAALMALGDLRQQIHKIDFQRAIDILEKTEKNMRLAYTIAGTNKLAPHINQISTILQESEEGIRMPDLFRRLSADLNRDEIKMLVSTVRDMDIAERVQDSGGKSWLVRKKSQTSS